MLRRVQVVLSNGKRPAHFALHPLPYLRRFGRVKEDDKVFVDLLGELALDSSPDLRRRHQTVRGRGAGIRSKSALDRDGRQIVGDLVHACPHRHSASIPAQRLNEEFEKRTKELFANSTEKQKSEAIVMAALLQREAFNASEMPLIAGIIYNRLRKNQLLQIDATIQYAIGTSKEWWPRPKREDYKIESAYNTYVKKGLPPAPICNPSLPAIEAALSPLTSDLMYYLHDATGAIHTATNFQEHLDNTRAFLRP